MNKYKNCTYYKEYFCGGGNDDIKLITCNDKNCYSVKTPKLRIIVVQYVSPSSGNV